MDWNNWAVFRFDPDVSWVIGSGDPVNCNTSLNYHSALASLLRWKPVTGNCFNKFPGNRRIRVSASLSFHSVRVIRKSWESATVLICKDSSLWTLRRSHDGGGSESSGRTELRGNEDGWHRGSSWCIIFNLLLNWIFRFLFAFFFLPFSSITLSSFQSTTFVVVRPNKCSLEFKKPLKFIW